MSNDQKGANIVGVTEFEGVNRTRVFITYDASVKHLLRPNHYYMTSYKRVAYWKSQCIKLKWPSRKSPTFQFTLQSQQPNPPSSLKPSTGVQGGIPYTYTVRFIGAVARSPTLLAKAQCSVFSTLLIANSSFAACIGEDY